MLAVHILCEFGDTSKTGNSTPDTETDTEYDLS